MFNTTSPKVRRQILALLANKWAFGCFSIFAIQQLIESSSTLWLVTMMQKITAGETFFPFLCLYLSSLVLPYLPGCFANIMKITWKQEALRSFVQAFVSSNRNHIADWGNKGLKEEKLSILTAEGPTAIHALIDYIIDLYTYVLSVIFNILALSIVVEPLFAVAYGVSIIAVLFIMSMKRRTQRKLTKKALTARIELVQSLLAAWDNVLLGNDYNFRIWEEKTSQRLNRCMTRNVELERFDQILAICTCLLTSIPSLMVVVYYVYTHQNDVSALVSFLVTLPLLFMILSYTYQTLSIAFRWGMHKSRLLSIYRTIQPSRDSQSQLAKKVKWPKIELSLKPIKEQEEGIEHISAAFPKYIQTHHDIVNYSSQPGRVTIRGENGSGKSTLLMLIKYALSEKAFLLPTQNQLSFLAETNKYSTGESLRNRLHEILERVEANVLLLDEWDANLDSENRERLTTLIDELAEKKCVIEVIHR